MEIDGIARRFGRRWVLTGASLKVRCGEAIGLLGRNGSGKTTLLRILATALRPTRGGGRVFGFDLVGDADLVRGCVGLMGHHAGLYEDLTALENLRFAMRMSGRAVDAAGYLAALEKVGLGREADERVRTFSAGMRRRLTLARLQLNPPNLLLLDEPYASFDADGIERVNELIMATRARGGAAIIATHDPARTQPVVTRMLRIENGRLQPPPFGDTGRPGGPIGAALAAVEGG